MPEPAKLPFRTGLGYDIHPFATEPRPLVLGGFTIPGARGLDGHSDADVLCHALADALLGAVGKPDIGHYFPNTDPEIRGIASTLILERAAREVVASGYTFGNADVTLVAEQPRLISHFPAIRASLAGVLGTTGDRIGLKATTNEGLGALGRGEGIAVWATVLVLAT